MMRRTAHAVLALGTVLAGLAVGAAPAAAADDEVRLRMPRDFTAGGPPAEVTMEVVRGEDDCVAVSMLLEAEVPGADDGQVRVALRDGDRWRPLRMSRTGQGRYVTEPVAPDDPRVCGDDPRASVLFQVTLAAGVTGDEVKLVGHAYNESGELLDATDESRELRAGRVSPSPRTSRSPSPTPVASVTSAAELAAPVASFAAATAPLEPDTASAGSGGLLMGLGVALVGLGIGLLIVVVRRNRRDPGPPGADGQHTMVLPRIAR